ncbi:galactose oxidase [Gigaspora margarita]|uniref:Galactose oxidase n=1 Tax=Gigaspora margarita TaxID=4874 RepID=A0A8H4A7P4_GIGMA|nr:galactose oxidase [Gigaspora margarita]
MDSFKNYFCLWLTIILAWTSTVAEGFKPHTNFVQSSALVGNKFHFFGSIILTDVKDNVILDVTPSKLNTLHPLWFLSKSLVLTDSAFASACVGGSDKNIIYLLEHHDTNSNITNKTIVFGGFKVPSPGGILNDINIFDTLNLTWIKGSRVNAPTSRTDFIATLLKNGLILYLGGGDDINMAKIPIYNTNNNTWSAMIATGDNINSRCSHTAVLSLDGHVVIYGGSKDKNFPLHQSQQLASLDTTVNPYK